MTDQTRTILIVDDDASVRQVLSDYLQQGGYRVIDEGQALAVIRRVIKEKPDLVLLDLKMPGATGFQIIRALRRAQIAVPIVIISGYLDGQNVRILNDLGIRHILAKPVSHETLHRVVQDALPKAPPGPRPTA